MNKRAAIPWSIRREDGENAWTRGRWTIRIVGTTASGKACQWGLYFGHAEFLSRPSKYFPRGSQVVYDSLAGAKRRVDQELVAEALGGTFVDGKPRAAIAKAEGKP